MEQAEADRSEAAAAGKARPVIRTKLQIEGPRLGDVQPRHRQQTAGLRSGRNEGGRRGPERLHALRPALVTVHQVEPVVNSGGSRRKLSMQAVFDGGLDNKDRSLRMAVGPSRRER